MTMRKLLFLAALGASLLATPASPANAPSCRATPLLPRRRWCSTARCCAWNSRRAGKREVTTFRVHGAVKGVGAEPAPIDLMRRRGERTVTILSSVHDAECGWDFRAGPQRLTVGASRDGSDLVATRCIIYNLNRTILPQ